MKFWRNHFYHLINWNNIKPTLQAFSIIIIVKYHKGAFSFRKYKHAKFGFLLTPLLLSIK